MCYAAPSYEVPLRQRVLFALKNAFLPSARVAILPHGIFPVQDEGDSGGWGQGEKITGGSRR